MTMAEKHFVFLKNNRVEQIAVFASQDEELADGIAHEQGYDDALWIGEDPVPHLHSLYDPATKTFTDPDLDHLNSIGLHTETNEQYEARIKQQYEEDAERLAKEAK
jgi:hypothetical protein